MAEVRQTARWWRFGTGNERRQSTGADRIESGNEAMVTRLTGALARAIFIFAIICTPALLLPGTARDVTMTLLLVALVAAIFVTIEYMSKSPSLVEFRDAPPFNRIRVVSIFLSIFVLTLILRGQNDPSTITRLMTLAGGEIGAAMDFPYSPVRLVTLMLPDGTQAAQIDAVRVAAGLSYLASILAIGAFMLFLRMRGWPGRTGTFNVWVNLPTFDPTAGGDVVERLRRDAQVNLILGFLLPFLIPAFIEMATNLVGPLTLSNPHTLIWAMTGWAFLPASMLMRGIALNRVADMISAQRRVAYRKDEAGQAEAAHAA